eukprot:9483793-Prorocentrum_lima.AAC.1
MEHGSSPNQLADTCTYITAFFVLPTAHCTSLVALVRDSARANDQPVLKAVFFGIGPENDPEAS